MNALTASVVIPTFNRVALLERSLLALTAQTASPNSFEVIVVDDGSTDGTAAMVAGMRTPYALVYVAQQRSGVAVARNAGVARARGEIVCFLDDDVVADPSLVAAYVAGHTRFPNSALVGKLRFANENGPLALQALVEELRQRQAEMERELTAFDLLTGNCSLRRSTLVTVGGFDTSLPSAEDFELALRLEEHGVMLRYCPEASGTEHYRRGTDVFVDGAFRSGWAHALIARKHRRAARLLRLERQFESPMRKRLPLRAVWFASKLLPRPTRPTAPRDWPGPSWVWRRIGTLFYWAGVRRGIESLAALEQVASPELIILGYHVVDDPRHPVAAEYRVTPDRFAEQIAHLKARGFTTITVGDWVRGLAGRTTLPARPLILTFDDGDRRTFSTVLPVLSAAGFRATVFVVSNAIGATNRWDEAIGLRRRTLASELELQALARSGWEIGSHSLTHLSLPTLPDDVLRDEVGRSRTELEARLGVAVTVFAYPYGNYDRTVIDAVRRAGYEAACCSDPGINGPDTDPFRLRRIFVSPHDNLATFAAKLRSARAIGRTAAAERFYQRVAHQLGRPE